MATSSVDLTIDGRDDEDPDFNEESGSSSDSNTAPPKKRGRGRPRKNKPPQEKKAPARVSQNDLINNLVKSKLSPPSLKEIKSRVGEIHKRNAEILEDEIRPFEDAISSYIPDPRVRATKVRQINKDSKLESLDHHGVGKKLNIPFDKMAEDASASLQGFDNLHGDTERAISEEQIFEYFKKGKPKLGKKFSEDNIKEAMEEFAQEGSELFSSFNNAINDRIKEIKKTKSEIQDHSKDSDTSWDYQLDKPVSEMSYEEREEAHNSFLLSDNELATGRADSSRDESKLFGFSSPLQDEETFNKFSDSYTLKNSSSSEQGPNKNRDNLRSSSKFSDEQWNMGGPTGSDGGDGGNKPPAPPSFPEDEEFGSDDGNQATREDLKKQRDKELNKQVNKDFSDLRKEENRKAAQEKAQKDREFKERRRLIRDEAKIAKSQINKGKEEDTTDRIVRRLAAFDLGRSLGGSGSLFAAASEKFVFRPSEDKAAINKESFAAEMAKQEGDKISQLEEDIFSEKMRVGKSKFDKNKIIDDAKFKADNETDPEKKRAIFEQLKSQLSDDVIDATLVKDSPTPSKPSPTAPPVSTPTTPPNSTTPPPTPPPASTPPSSSNNKTNNNTGLTGPINPNLPPVPPAPPNKPPKSPPPGPKPKPGPKPGPKVTPGPSMAAIGNVYLGAAAAVQIFSAAMDGATEVAKGFGSVIGSDQTKPSSSETVDAAGKVAKIGGQTAGAVGGAAAGAALGSAFPVVGTVAGGLVGAAVGGSVGGKALEPVIEAINTGNALMEKQTEASLGPMTIIARTQAQIDGLFKKIENDFEVDAITAEFATARGELGRAIQDLQVNFISEFGPYLISLVELLTKVVEILPSIMEVNKRIFEAILLLIEIARNPTSLITNFGEISKKLDFIVNGTAETAENTKKAVDAEVTNSINDQLQNFFGATPVSPIPLPTP